MTSDDMLKNLFKNNREMFLETLGSYILVDIGTIESVDKNGRARVLTNQYVANQRVIYQDVEVIYPGNPCGAYMAECSGSACLILFPYMCMPNTDTRKLRPSTVPYNKDGIKVMPIGNGSKSVVRHFINSAGEYSLSTAKYDIFFDKDTISLTQGDALSISKDAKGSLYLRHKDDQTGAFLFSLDKEGISRTYSSLNGDVIWEDVIKTDGTRTFTQKDGNDKVLSKISISTDGAVTIESVKAVTVKSKEDLVVNTDGDIKMNGSTKHLVKYEDLNTALTKLYVAMTTTPIMGNGAPQPTWIGITGIDISAAKADSLLTGD